MERSELGIEEYEGEIWMEYGTVEYVRYIAGIKGEKEAYGVLAFIRRDFLQAYAAVRLRH